MKVGSTRLLSRLALEKSRRLTTGLLTVACIACLACGEGNSEPEVKRERPASSDGLERSTLSAGGRYRIGVRPAIAPIPLGAMHDWVVRIELADGNPASPSTLAFDGGMPSHGHGFVTAPRVTRDLGNGEYLVEGVKFHMAGEWEVRVAVTEGSSGDRASFVIDVDP